MNDDAGILLMERGVRYMEFIMSQIEVRQRVREQQAKQKEIVLKYRGVAYIVKRDVKNWIKKFSSFPQL